MIYDKIDNYLLYRGLSEDIFLGFDFLFNVNSDIEIGVHLLSSTVKAIVTEYETKKNNENGYEAHKKFIDIQYLLKGAEKLCCLPIEKLQETKAYNDQIDAAFYNAEVQSQEMVIGDGYFAIYYPQDGHIRPISTRTSKCKENSNKGRNRLNGTLGRYYHWS